MSISRRHTSAMRRKIPKCPVPRRRTSLTNEQTNSPVIGMLVGERFVQIQIGVENSTDDQAKTLAAMVAARVS